jgi:hypothetical protein
MTDVWRKPYHVVIEVKNRKCRMLKVDEIKSPSSNFSHSQAFSERNLKPAIP